jgi:hypothetical protein
MQTQANELVVAREDARHDDALPITFSPSFLKSESKDFFWLVGRRNGEEVFVQPVLRYKKAIFNFARFPDAPFSRMPTSATEEREFLDACAAHLRSADCDFIMQSSTTAVFRAVPTGATAIPFGTYRIDLTQPTEVLFKGLHPKHRNSINGASKKGCTVRPLRTDELDLAFDIISGSFQRSGGHFINREKFHQQYENFGSHVLTMGVFSSEGVIQGCGIFPYTKATALYLHGGSVPAPVSGAMNLLHWQAILQFKELGVEVYDFVGARVSPAPGSRFEGIKNFKARFGGQFLQGYMWRLPFSAFKFSLFKIVFRLIANGQGDIIDQELRPRAA